ncbi:hypothetical protein MCM1_0780 [Methanosarcina barkeri CM1]|uniref:Uncharacterized protein n=1 Tax=Methanosarcina barkeri CM1 TaxID=796385 RepID=A0A0G3CDB1_METBA|nr:hypothetical protein MCM1_0780 [Methanosarcina barkeri CM1]
MLIGEIGCLKATLHNMKQNAESDKPFTLNSHVLERVKTCENLVLDEPTNKMNKFQLELQ